MSSHQRHKLLYRTIDYNAIDGLPLKLRVLSHRERMQLDDAWQRRTEGEALAECLAIATCDADVESLLATLTTRECYEIVAAAFTAASLTDEERKKSLSSPTACTGKSAEAVDEDIAR